MARRTPDLEQQLRHAILKNRLSRYRISRLSGVAEAVLSNFVNGHRSVTLKTASKLAKVLRLELRDVDEKR